VDRLTHFTGATILHEAAKWSTSEFLAKDTALKQHVFSA
jgi:hypothetical protein